MKPFDELTKPGQTRRIRVLAEAALAEYPIKVARLKLIQNSWNVTYRVDTTRGKTYILRINRAGPVAHRVEELEAEMAWVDALHRETKLGVPQPLANRKKSLITLAEVPGVPEPRYCAVFGWLPGTVVGSRISPKNYFKMGQLSAQLHLHGKTFKPPHPKKILAHKSPLPYRDKNVLFEPAYRKWFTAKQRDIIKQSMKQTQAAIDDLFKKRRGKQIIHNDLHHWNVMLHQGKVSPFDFEDLMWGFPVQDVAISLFYVQYHDKFSDLLQAFCQGYETQATWPERYDGEIYHHMAARRLMFINYLIQTKDPEDRAFAPDYIKLAEPRLKEYLKSL